VSGSHLQSPANEPGGTRARAADLGIGGATRLPGPRPTW